MMFRTGCNNRQNEYKKILSLDLAPGRIAYHCADSGAVK